VYDEISKLETRPAGKADSLHSVYFDQVGRVTNTPVFLLDKLNVGNVIEGPAMIIDATQTIVLIPGAKATVTSKHLYITLPRR
jgi:5-oxoprolinase (ATP-hydrolysing)